MVPEKNKNKKEEKEKEKRKKKKTRKVGGISHRLGSNHNITPSLGESKGTFSPDSSACACGLVVVVVVVGCVSYMSCLVWI